MRSELPVSLCCELLQKAKLLVYLAGQDPAIHYQHVAGDKARRMGAQEDRCSYEFLYLAESSHRRAHQKLTSPARAVQQFCIQFRAKYAGDVSF